jgi:hypothetical protein
MTISAYLIGRQDRARFRQQLEVDRDSPSPTPPAHCADCVREVPPNPAFAVNRCAPCAIRAGRASRKAPEGPP